MVLDDTDAPFGTSDYKKVVKDLILSKIDIFVVCLFFFSHFSLFFWGFDKIVHSIFIIYSLFLIFGINDD